MIAPTLDFAHGPSPNEPLLDDSDSELIHFTRPANAAAHISSGNSPSPGGPRSPRPYASYSCHRLARDGSRHDGALLILISDSTPQRNVIIWFKWVVTQGARTRTYTFHVSDFIAQVDLRGEEVLCEIKLPPFSTWCILGLTRLLPIYDLRMEQYHERLYWQFVRNPGPLPSVVPDESLDQNMRIRERDGRLSRIFHSTECHITTKHIEGNGQWKLFSDAAVAEMGARECKFCEKKRNMVPRLSSATQRMLNWLMPMLPAF